MNVTKIEENLQALIADLDEESFIYDLLMAYGLSKSAITRLKTGTYNVASGQDEVLWKKKVFYKKVLGKDLHATIDGYRRDASVTRHSPRFIIVTDFKTLLAVDTKTDDTLDIALAELNRHFDFFLPWAGREKAQVQIENPADVKAAGRMAQLYDEICKDNPYTTDAELHALNVFLCRLLFCFFAEDTEIFKEQACFTNSLKNQTQEDGSDVSQHLERLFEVLSLPENDPKRKKYPAFLQAFPYVNGGLFKDEFKAPDFSKKSRKLLLDSGDLDWSAINPDIFGSMMQAVVRTGKKGDELQRHYTSVPNILKVIEPLFLSDLYDELEKAKDDFKKLQRLHQRITKVRIFDPACGSGNFLIIAYKELRKLEIEIFKSMQDVSGQITFSIPKSLIPLTQFYGIEIDDFAHEIATLSLWLAEHQMNVLFKDEFGETNPSLPLKEGGNIVCHNATRVSWDAVCPKDNSEIYVLGNPPYIAYSERNTEQKSDMDHTFDEVGNVKRLDYIGCWFKLATDYIENTNFKYAFLSTNSICQGEQVSLLWPYIFSKDQEISFAHQSFKWSNNAKGKAGVTCIVAGIQNKRNNEKVLFSEDLKKYVKSISPYLIEGDPIIVYQRKEPISDLPEMALGSSGIDGGHLLLSPQERLEFISENSDSELFIKPYIGGGDFIDGTERYCLWIDDNKVDEALSIPKIRDRINKCLEFRLSAGRDAKKAANVPHRFFYRKYKNKPAVILPMTSSERRQYLPLGFANNGVVASNGVFVIYDVEPFIFGILSSKIHNIWARTVAGKLEERIRYSNALCYNSFPLPKLTEQKKQTITSHVWDVVSEREKHPEKTIAQLYDPDKMPDGLREAHLRLDVAVEQCYRIKPFTSDEERLEYLFKLYEEMTQSEQRELQHA